MLNFQVLQCKYRQSEASSLQSVFLPTNVSFHIIVNRSADNILSVSQLTQASFSCSMFDYMCCMSTSQVNKMSTSTAKFAASIIETLTDARDDDDGT